MANKTTETTPLQERKTLLQPVEYPLPLVEEMTAWPIHKLSQGKEDFMQYASDFTTELLLQKKRKESLSEAIAKVLYLERMRIANEPWKVDPPDEMDFWNDIRKNLLRKSMDQNEEEVRDHNSKLLHRIIRRYNREIMSNFKIPTYKMAQKFLPRLFATILNASSRFRAHKKLQKKLQIVGHVEHIRSLATKGTIVLVPTHFSNLDSILVGWASDQIGLSAFTYGAGINLYNKILGYLFPRLGAYGLDRRKKNDFYLETLKTYSQLNIERNVHSLFFPGGTRSRSGSLEDKLKMGLLGTAIDAQGNLLRQGKENKIFIVPVVLNYHCVLEAKNLINSHLEKMGKELYLIEKKAFGGAYNLFKFFWKFFSSDSEIVVNFGQPMDVLGNFVDTTGNSLDQNGQILQIKDYFISNGQIEYDGQRNEQYTKMLARQIVRRYHEETVVLSSHIVAFVAFNLLSKLHPSLDIYGLLRLPEEDRVIELPLFYKNLDILRRKLLALNKAGKIRLSERVKEDDIDNLAKHGIRNTGVFHVEKALYINKQGTLASEDMNLLLYYHNRMKGYNLATHIAINL